MNFADDNYKIMRVTMCEAVSVLTAKSKRFRLYGLFKLFIFSVVLASNISGCHYGPDKDDKCYAPLALENPVPDTTLRYPGPDLIIDMLKPPTVFSATRSEIALFYYQSMEDQIAQVSFDGTFRRILRVTPKNVGETTINITIESCYEIVTTSFSVKVVES